MKTDGVQAALADLFTRMQAAIRHPDGIEHDEAFVALGRLKTEIKWLCEEADREIAAARRKHEDDDD